MNDDPCFDDLEWSEWRKRFWRNLEAAKVKDKLVARINALISKEQAPAPAEADKTCDYWWVNY